MKLSKFQKLFDPLYTDRMTVLRHVEVENEDGTTGIELPDPALLEHVPCRISYVSDDSSDKGEEDRNSLHKTIKVFCKPDVDVQRGDKLVLLRMSEDGLIVRTLEGIANDARVYPTHIEIIFADKGDA